MDTQTLLSALQSVEKRAERGSDEYVAATYVDTGGLRDALLTTDNGSVFGRRGTGKTHALKYLAENERDAGALVFYLDVERDLGSTEGIYSDGGLPLTERATRLLVDVLGIIHDQLLSEAFDGPLGGQIGQVERMLDHFGAVLVTDTVESEATGSSESSQTGGLTAGAGLTGTSPSLSLTAKSEEAKKETTGRRTTVAGKVAHRVHFGAFGRGMREVLLAHPARRVWFIFDEWSSLPLDLQPYLAEMLRRLFFGIPKVSVRIAAIPHRTEWRVQRDDGLYIGVEVGAEMFPILDLDEFVVFPARNKAEQTRRSTDFFGRLLTRHLNQILIERGATTDVTVDEVTRLLFTQVTALQELVRAAEGVPRDALLIAARAGLRASDRPISTEDVRAAAAQVYQSTKQAMLNGNPHAQQLLDTIQRDVISQKKARAFLLASEHTNHALIQKLIDERILHVIKRGYSDRDTPGKRYDVLEIDYGCYVSRLKTTTAPQGLFGIDEINEDASYSVIYADDYAEVPEDDYRAIRRAILDLPALLAALN